MGKKCYSIYSISLMILHCIHCIIFVCWWSTSVQRCKWAQTTKNFKCFQSACVSLDMSVFTLIFYWSDPHVNIDETNSVKLGAIHKAQTCWKELPQNQMRLALLSGSRLTFAMESGSDSALTLQPECVWKMKLMRSSLSIALMSSWLALLTVSSWNAPMIGWPNFWKNAAGSGVTCFCRCLEYGQFFHIWSSRSSWAGSVVGQMVGTFSRLCEMPHCYQKTNGFNRPVAFALLRVLQMSTTASIGSTIWQFVCITISQKIRQPKFYYIRP